MRCNKMKKIHDIEISGELIPFYYVTLDWNVHIGNISTMYLIIED